MAILGMSVHMAYLCSRVKGQECLLYVGNVPFLSILRLSIQTNYQHIVSTDKATPTKLDQLAYL